MAVLVDKEDVVSGPASCSTVVTDSTEGKKTANTLATTTDEKKLLAGGQSNAPLWGVIAAGLGAAFLGAGVFAAMGGKSTQKKKRSIRLSQGEDWNQPHTAAQLYEQMATGEFSVEEVGYARIPGTGFGQLQVAPMAVQQVPQ